VDPVACFGARIALLTIGDLDLDGGDQILLVRMAKYARRRLTSRRVSSLSFGHGLGLALDLDHLFQRMRWARELGVLAMVCLATEQSLS